MSVAGALVNTSTSTSGAQSQAANQNGTATTTNQYSSGQVANQGAGNSLLQGILQGGQPAPNMGLTQGAWDQANTNFQLTQAHQMANQFGQGSATIPIAQQQMNADLAARSSQMAWQNLQGVFNDVANIAYSPTGASTTNNQNQNSTGNQAATSDSSTTDIGSLLTGIFSSLGGGF